MMRINVLYSVKLVSEFKRHHPDPTEFLILTVPYFQGMHMSGQSDSDLALWIQSGNSSMSNDNCTFSTYMVRCQLENCLRSRGKDRLERLGD